VGDISRRRRIGRPMNGEKSLCIQPIAYYFWRAIQYYLPNP